MIKPSETSDILQQQLDNVDLKAEFEEIGTVLEVGDGVANVFGLDNVTSGELIEFENGVYCFYSCGRRIVGTGNRYTGRTHRRGRADYRRSVGAAFGKKGSRGNLSAAC